MDREVTDKTTAGAAALSICESLLIALNDLKIIDEAQRLCRGGRRHSDIGESRGASVGRGPDRPHHRRQELGAEVLIVRANNKNLKQVLQ